MFYFEMWGIQKHDSSKSLESKIERFDDVRNVEWIDYQVGIFIMWSRLDTGCGAWFSTGASLAQPVNVSCGHSLEL